MHRRHFLHLSALATAAGATRGLARAQTPDDRMARLAALVTAKMAEYGVPGVGLGLLHDGRVTLRGFGVRSLDDGQPVTADTVFTIASISKTMAATAVMALARDGKVDLGAPVTTYVPGFRVADPAATREVSLWHLLTHTPGWEGQLSTEDRGAYALEHFATTFMRDLPQLAPPGRVWSYNNAGFSLAGHVIEAVTGRSIHDALRELVFAPLGLTRTFTRLTDAATWPLSLGHRERGGTTEVQRPYQSTSGITAGGVMTSLTDLMAYARFHLGNGAAPDGRPYLSRDVLDRMQSRQVEKHGTDDAMGLGWHLRPVGGVMTCAHGGTLNSHCLHLQLVPARGLAFAILTNHVNGWRLVQDVEHAILADYAGVRLTPGQRIGHRGVNEAMTFHSTPLDAQPALDEYVGTYERPPLKGVTVRRGDAGLTVGSATGQGGASIVFYGRDVAYATAGAYVGSPYEFIRGDDGAVRWIRVNGRVAVRLH